RREPRPWPRSISPTSGSRPPRRRSPPRAPDPVDTPDPSSPHGSRLACRCPASRSSSAPIMPHTSLCGPATPMSSPQEPDEMAEEPAHESDAGSITPLAIGFVVIALLLAFLIAALTDLHMARRQLQGLADSAALAASDSFEPAPGEEPGLVFSPPAAKRAAGPSRAAGQARPDMHDLRLSADADGARSGRIRIHARYSPALLSPFMPGLIDLHATAYARGALRLS